MTETEQKTEEIQSGEGFAPPYGSFTTLANLIDRMADEGGIPARIDRSYLSNLASSVISTTTHALKSLDLADTNLHPTQTLIEMVEQPAQRKSIWKGIIQEKYAPQLALGKRATTAQLEASFREGGATGSTVRKQIAFFLSAARYAGVEVSPYFKTPSAPRSTPRNGARNVQPLPGRTPPAPPAPEPKVESDLDPFILGLVKALPKPGSEFPIDRQKAWIDTAQGIFKLLYKTDSDSTEALPQISHDGGGESD